MPNSIFMVFATVAILAACSVVLIKNPVKAVLSLILCFIATAATWLTLDAEFLAWALILVYVGAVMVLFLFVVMMLDIRSIRYTVSRWLPIGMGVTMALVAFLLIVMLQDGFVMNKHLAPLAYGEGNVSNTALLGNYIFSKYLAQFEIAGIMLLVAIIAAIGLIYRGPRDRKMQNIHTQIAADPKQRVKLVDGD